MGELIPIGMYEVLPGDTCQQATNALIRAAPMLAPVMHPVEARIHHWYVPYRTVWDDFEDFITGGPTGDDTSVFPTMTAAGGEGVGSLADYMGIPTGIVGIEYSALPMRAYAAIYNEYYRDQDLKPELPLVTTSGDDSTTNRTLQNIAWEKDFFTDARPWEQKGPAITVPIGGVAPVNFSEVGGQTPQGVSLVRAGNAADSPVNVFQAGTQAAAIIGEVDLTGVSTVTVTALREALALQRYSEARARFGSRYVEYLRYLGVKSSDARLQRPEFLGGGRETIQFSEVLATAEGTNTDVGDLKGHGITAMKSNRYRRFFEEHGIVISLLSVRPKTIYTTGLERLWNRRIKEDFWQKELEHIGQQEVLNKEIQAAHTNPEGVFGYVDRYHEYRRVNSSVVGEFRTSALDYWHLAREFSGDVALNGDFTDAVPSKRIFAEQTQDCLYVMAKHSIQARRLVSKTGNSYIY